MSTIDKRWNTSMLDKIEYHMKQITLKVIINYSDSRDSLYIHNTQLSGGILSMVWNKWESYVNKEKLKSNPLGR